MKRKKYTNTREFNRVVTSFTVYKFIKDIITPFTKSKLFKEKKIDKNGNYLIDQKQIPIYDRLIVNLKKLLAKIPNPTIKSELKHLTTALTLFTEETKQHGADPDQVFNEIVEYLASEGLHMDSSLDELLNEEMIANSVGAGGVYGARGNTDETIVNQMAHLKRMGRIKKRFKARYINIS
jgi:hypothetical protein